MTKNTPSLRDVALNNKSNVLPNMRSQVLKAAADLGYKLHIRVPTTISSKLNTVGVVVKRDPGEFPRLDPFYYAVLCGVENECERLGLNLMYVSLPVNEYSHAMGWPSLLENSDVDGLVIIGAVFTDPTATNRIPHHIPIVVIDSFAAGIICDTVITHKLRGAHHAVSYLIEQGHTRIGLIGSRASAPEHPGIRDKCLGYVGALSDRAITETYIEDCLLRGECAYAATTCLLQRAPNITAIFACNDDVAQHAMRAVQDSGRSVPGDISIIGFDDTIDALNAQPPLTTMRVDQELMGKMAVRQLYERAINPDRPPITTLIGTRLIVRESVAKCADR